MRRAVLSGPAFISDQAEEQHHLDVLRDPLTDFAARAATRVELARLYERHGHFAEAAEMYERNVWEGVRTPATFAGLAGVYRQLGRDDLADATLEQVRRQGGADRAAVQRRAAQPETTAVQPRQPVARTAVADRRTPTSRRESAPPATSAPAGRQPSWRTASAQQPASTGGVADLLRQGKEIIAPFLAGQAGRRTLIASMVLLPVALGIFVAIVLTSARSRAADQAPAPTAAPVATIVPTTAATAAPSPAVPAALSQPPAPARLIVNNVGPEGLSLRRTPGVSGQRIKVWNDGTAMADLGETADQNGQGWRKVRDPDGNVGWTAAEFLADPGVRSMAATGAQPAPGALPAPAAPRFASGGLGLTRTEWEKTHGQPSRSSIFLEYDGGRLVVGLLESNVWHIERIWMRSEAVSLDAAREDARAYLPSDATQVQSLDRGDGKIIDVYTSALLGSRFGSTAWNGGKAGTFTIQYKVISPADRKVLSAMFRLGDSLF